MTERTKLVIRHLPPNLPEEIFWKSCSTWLDNKNHPEGKSKVISKYYVSGKVRKNKNKVDIPSRAYIQFATPDQVVEFHQGYAQQAFRNSQGQITYPKVEFAPYQKAPGPPKKIDNRINTIESDPDYQAFIEKFNAPATPVPTLPAKGDETTIDPQKLEVTKITPLIEHLRNARKAAQEATLAAKQQRLAATNKPSTSSTAHTFTSQTPQIMKRVPPESQTQTSKPTQKQQSASIQPQANGSSLGKAGKNIQTKKSHNSDSQSSAKQQPSTAVLTANKPTVVPTTPNKKSKSKRPPPPATKIETPSRSTSTSDSNSKLSPKLASATTNKGSPGGKSNHTNQPAKADVKIIQKPVAPQSTSNSSITTQEPTKGPTRENSNTERGGHSYRGRGKNHSRGGGNNSYKPGESNAGGGRNNNNHKPNDIKHSKEIKNEVKNKNNCSSPHSSSGGVVGNGNVNKKLDDQPSNSNKPNNNNRNNNNHQNDNGRGKRRLVGIALAGIVNSNKK